MADSLIETLKAILREVAQISIDDVEFERIKPTLISLITSVKMLDEIEIPLETEPASYFVLPKGGEKSGQG